MLHGHGTETFKFVPCTMNSIKDDVWLYLQSFSMPLDVYDKENDVTQESCYAGILSLLQIPVHVIDSLDEQKRVTTCSFLLKQCVVLVPPFQRNFEPGKVNSQTKIYCSSQRAAWRRHYQVQLVCIVSVHVRAHICPSITVVFESLRVNYPESLFVAIARIQAQLQHGLVQRLAG